MAVAVSDGTDSPARSPQSRLILESWLGAVFILASLAAVFLAVPRLWNSSLGTVFTAWFGANSLVEMVLRFAVMAACGVGLYLLGLTLAGPNPQPGSRAGRAMAVAFVAITFFLSVGFGRLLQSRILTDPSQTALGLGLMVGLAVALLVVAGWLYRTAGFARFLDQFEKQGWFSLSGYKKNQGIRVRRGTILGVILVLGTGIWTLSSHRVFSGSADWSVTIPFTDLLVTLLPQMAYSAPLLLTLAMLWFAVRLVNMPVFADFLIATESELNKVSWSSRKQLIRDTIVVLVTVFLMTVFLLIVDLFWGKVFSVFGFVPEAKKDRPSMNKQVDQGW